MTIRVGQGYDIHRLKPGLPLWLGGVKIDSPLGSEAHSDGDALLHALIDALLGAAALGDIGDHFPPSNPQYQNIASSVLLEKVLTVLRTHHYQISNCDATVFLESPKLYPYKDAIRQQLAILLSLETNAVSFKAKTAEGFPPVGTSEAIAASVTVLIQTTG